jgi:hypothetical protein
MRPLQLDFAEDFARATQVPVHGPLCIRTTPAGALEILCYQELGQTAISTVVKFFPDAAGQLVYNLSESVKSGAIKLSITKETSAVQ